MIRTPALLRLTAAGACALALSGCISLLPKTKPAHLYTFGTSPAAKVQAVPAGRSIGVFRASGLFQRESAGDRLLGITGDKAAYIAETRWVAPASVLFEQAVAAAFDAAPGKVRLVARGEPGVSTYTLRLDVRNFETRYDAGPDAAPTVVIRVRAILVGDKDKGVAGEQLLEARVRAGDNKVAAIVSAYDKALDEVLGKLVSWTEATAT